jgi:hypothetical protein
MIIEICLIVMILLDRSRENAAQRLMELAFLSHR